MAVYLSLAPPDGFEEWTAAEWDAWLETHPWEPAESLCERGTWLVLLYQCRTHARRSAPALAPFMERLITERPLRSTAIAALRRALHGVTAELSDIAASRLWTGTSFYSPDELNTLIADAESRTKKRGVDLSIADLWQPQLDAVDRVLARALEEERGVYFGNV